MDTFAFTQPFEKILTQAQQFASQQQHTQVEPLHVLQASLMVDAPRQWLMQAGSNIETLEASVKKALHLKPNGALQGIHPDLQTLLHKSQALATKQKDQYISTDTFLLALLQSKDEAAQLIKASGVTESTFETVMQEHRQGQSIESPLDDALDETLAQYTLDVTEQAQNGLLDPVIGRDEEIRRTIQVLQRRTKNNPVLIGSPGVGKTAIVEGLAQRMINGEVPEGLKHKRLLALDMAAMVAGAKYRGEFEERLKGVLRAISKANGQIILFIDEMHTMVGAGKTEGAMDAGNMLKPALARGELHCIGATTLDEYRQYIEKDAALERRFQKVMVHPPSVEDTIAILRGIKERYELHHGVTIRDEAIIAAATQSERYITDRNLPDKAIDLMDEAASQLRMSIDSKPDALEKISRKLIQKKIEREALKKDDQAVEALKQLDDDIALLEKEHAGLDEQWQGEKARLKQTQLQQEQLDQARIQLEQANRDGDLSKMSELQYGTIPTLEKQLKAQKDSQDESPLLRHWIGSEEINEVIAKWTGIPVQKLMTSDKAKLLHLEDTLHQSVIGQEKAITAVANAVRRSRSGLSDPHKPIGSFLFLGPTGVGKTEVCRSLAKYLFDREDAMIRIDMSEYMEKHSVSRLIGAPPGYVGYDAGGYLTEAVRRNPHCVVLLDEVEKAHLDVFHTLLQVLDDGRLTDGQGRTVNFRQSLVIMTSNLGQGDVDYMPALHKHFPPEFINRIDEIIRFESLSDEDLNQIVGLQLKRVEKRLHDQDIGLTVDEKVLPYLAQLGDTQTFGARPIKRLIQQYIENPLAAKILDKPENHFTISLKKDQIIIKP